MTTQYETHDTPTLTTIASELRDARRLHDRIVKEIRMARASFDHRIHIQSNDHPLWQAIIDRELPALTETEDNAVRSLDRIIATIGDSITHLEQAGYRPGLTPAKHAEMLDLIPLVQAEFQSATAGSICASIEAALLHSDTARMAAYASLAGIIAARQFTKEPGDEAGGRWRIEELLTECRNRTASHEVRTQIAKATTLVASVEDTRRDIVDRRNQHVPEGQRIGTELERYAFGQRYQRPAVNLYDVNRLATRAGRETRQG
jgi:hypothetical protein